MLHNVGKHALQRVHGLCTQLHAPQCGRTQAGLDGLYSSPLPRLRPRPLTTAALAAEDAAATAGAAGGGPAGAAAGAAAGAGAGAAAGGLCASGM